MLELSAPSLLGATLLFAILIFVWWLIVDWSFGTSATADKVNHKTDAQHTNSMALVSNRKNPDRNISADSELNTTQELASSTLPGAEARRDSFASDKAHHNNTTNITAANPGSESEKSAASIQPTVTSELTAFQSADMVGNTADETVTILSGSSSVEITRDAATREKQNTEHNPAKTLLAQPLPALTSAPAGTTPGEQLPNASKAVPEGSPQPQDSQDKESYQSKTTQAKKKKPENNKQVKAHHHRKKSEPRISGKQGVIDPAVKIVSDCTAPGRTLNNKSQSQKESDDDNSKYQTAAKAGRPSAGGEVSLQIPTDALIKTSESPSAAPGTDTKQRTSPSDNSVTDKPADRNSPNLNTLPDNTVKAESALRNNIHSIKVATTNTAALRNKASNNLSTSAPVSLKDPARDATQRKQSSIEIVVAQQVSTKPTADNQLDNSTTVKQHNNALQAIPDTTDSNKSEIGDNAALRARLAASEQRILNLQSTINNLQTQPVIAAHVAKSPQPHNRPALLSKVRVLDNPRV